MPVSFNYALGSLLGIAVLAAGCSAGSAAGSAARGSAGSSNNNNNNTGGTASSPGPSGDGGSGNSLVVGLPTDGGSSTGGSGGAESCATQKANAAIVRQPVDIIVVIDNSGSMQDEIDAVARSINVDFANVLQTSGVDYRVILIPVTKRPAVRR